MPDTLVSLPVPLIPALLAVMLWRQDWGNRIPARLFALLFAQSALLSVLVALRFQYGLQITAPVQVGLTLLIGPLLYLGFAGFALSPDGLRRQARWHLGAVAALLIALQLLPRTALPDIAISASYLLYAILLLRLWQRGEDALSRSGLGQTRDLRHGLLGAVGLLLFLLVVDSAIAISFALQNAVQARRLISWGSALMMPALAVLLLALSRAPASRSAPAAMPRPDHEQAAAIEAAARELLTGTRLYLDPDLSLERLAKRLHLARP